MKDKDHYGGSKLVVLGEVFLLNFCEFIFVVVLTFLLFSSLHKLTIREEAGKIQPELEKQKLSNK